MTLSQVTYCQKSSFVEGLWRHFFNDVIFWRHKQLKFYT